MTSASTAPDQASLPEQAYVWLCLSREDASENQQPLGLRAACCRFGVTQPAATPTTPALGTHAILLPHLPPDSRLSRQKRQQAVAVQGLRHAVRVMNQVLHSLGLEQHPDKTFIGRVQRGFDFLGVQFTEKGETSPSAVALARHKEKTAQLYEHAASRERIEQYRQNWLRYLRGILGRDHPATRTQAGNLPHPTTMLATVLSSPNHSHLPRCPVEGVSNKLRTKKNEKDNTEQIRNLPRRDRWGRMCCFRG